MTFTLNTFSLHKLLTVCAVVLFFVLSSACSTKIGYLVTSIANPLAVKNIKLDNNTSSSYYTYQIGQGEPDTILFFIPGSGCTSLKYYLKPYLYHLTGSVHVFALQKRNLENSNMGLFDCDKAFLDTDHFTQWVIDNKRFVEEISRTFHFENKTIVLLGVSEGGNVAAAIAASTPVVSHLAILGSGGMKQIDELKLLVKKTGVNANIDDVFNTIVKDPTNIEKTVYGQTYKYWNSVAYVDPLKFYVTLDIPIFVGIGEADNNVPIESAIALHDYFEKRQKSNLTLCIYRHADHALVDPNGISHRSHFLTTMTRWVNKTVAVRTRTLSYFLPDGEHTLADLLDNDDELFVKCQ
ncbi:MAG: prolyl oligopeptidase family serine peptidase [Candidatus Thiodiazotropha endolucinida]